MSSKLKLFEIFLRSLIRGMPLSIIVTILMLPPILIFTYLYNKQFN